MASTGLTGVRFISDGVGFLAQGIGDGEVQLAGFVAASGAGEQVVPFDVDIDFVAQNGRKSGSGLNGCGAGDIATTRKFCQIHTTSQKSF